MSKNTLSIYGMGGCGINSINNIIIPSEAAGFPETFYASIDTSKSNIAPKSVNKGETFLIPGIDGSGKDRRFAYKLALPHIDSMLLASPPKNFNIVIFGLSGGSGSVLGPLLIEELIKRGEAVIGMCVISTASSKEANNAYQTLGTLQNLSVKSLKTPIVCCMYENTSTTTRAMVDDRIENDIRSIAMLVSGMNLEMDKKDLYNWLNYDRITKVPAQLVDLNIHLGKGTNTNEVESAIAIANLLPSKSDNELELGQMYSCVGYCSEATIGAYTADIPPMHFIISNQYMNARTQELSKVIKEFEVAEEALVSATIPSFDDGETNSGWLF